MNRLIWRKRTSIFIGLALAGCIFTVAASGVSPAPDGGYLGNNTAEGTSALFSLTSGVDNTGLGFQALFHETIGNYNTATGYRVLFSNTTGSQNTASGINALSTNTTGSFNTATGVNALYRNTTGGYNTATVTEAPKGVDPARLVTTTLYMPESLVRALAMV